MKEDVYLIRWLRANKFDMNAAEEALMENLRWRREFKMDDIQKENFDDVKDDFPVHIDTFDKKGQPVITAVAGQWDLRAGFLTGRDKRVLRYVYQTLDRAAQMVREAQQSGKNVRNTPLKYLSSTEFLRSILIHSYFYSRLPGLTSSSVWMAST